MPGWQHVVDFGPGQQLVAVGQQVSAPQHPLSVLQQTDVLDGPSRRVPLLHDPAEVGTDPRYAERTATGAYRTTPLRALWQHAPYFHDGSAKTLLDVVNHYDRQFGLQLSDQQKADLVEFLKTL